ncbi:MAG: phosphatidylglycerophosphatase A [Parvibaculaceae bacterium]
MLTKYIATWFGSGLIPKAPGTWGTIAAIPFAWVIVTLFGPFALLIAAVIAFAIGIWAAGAYATTIGKPDPSEVVIDEVAAIWLILAFVPMTWVGWFIAFVVFRFFDVAKPWPVSLADAKLKGGFGIMADDIIAALYTLLILWLMQFYLGS